MPRVAFHPTTLLASVRAYFGLEQAELARFLGVTRGYVSHVEAGRRPLSSTAFERLLPLGMLLPPGPLPQSTRVAELPATAPPPAAEPLEARRRTCRWQAAQLRYALLPLAQQAEMAQRWQQAHPALLPFTVGEAPRLSAAGLAQRTTAFGPAEVARFQLLRLQAEALEAEAAALTDLLATLAPAPNQPD